LLISIIIVNYKSSEILSKSIESLFMIETHKNFEVIIIDNFSEDNSRDIIKEIANTYKSVKYVFLDERKSFSFANNRGFDVSEGEYILIQNPDVIYTEPVIMQLVEKMKSNKVIGAICPLLMGENGKFQRNYFQRYPTLTQFILFYSVFGKFFHRFAFLMNKYLENQDIEKSNNSLVFVEQIPCAFFLTSRDVFIKAGKMDERYELFFEDVDLSYRINKEYKLAVDKTLRILHLGGVSFKDENNWWMYGRFVYSMYFFIKKNYGKGSANIFIFFSVSNSYVLITFEYIKKIFRKENLYRIKKHKYLINIFKNKI
jgi:N-acetylglucosaminyl-diphospho-decaprenol L-rhamnosyltransferase